LGAVQSTLDVGGCGNTCFGHVLVAVRQKASGATLSQQEKKDSADVQRGRVNISGFICKVLSKSSRRRTFDEFESMAVALRRALQH
jgi:hypothetical protein